LKIEIYFGDLSNNFYITNDMKKINIIFILFFSQFIFSQNLIQTDIQNKKVNYFIDLEKKLGSKIYQSNENHISFRDVEQPIIFERKEKGLPNLLVFYTFYKKDSIMAEILYEWDIYNFEKNDNNKKDLKYNKNFIKKYQSVVTEISKKHGKSKQEGNLANLSLLKSEGLKQNDDWQVNDSLKINSYITLSEYYKKEGAVTINPTHKMRVYVTNERESESEKPLKISPEKISEYDKNFFEFVNFLKISDYNSARNLLSEKIKKTATNEILEKIKEQINKEKELVNFMTGSQLLLDGIKHPLIQYKYSDDNSNSPKEYFMVIFEDDGKIIGFKPMKILF